MLELYDGKLSCTVLRGLGAGNSPRLPGASKNMNDKTKNIIDEIGFWAVTILKLIFVVPIKVLFSSSINIILKNRNQAQRSELRNSILQYMTIRSSNDKESNPRGIKTVLYLSDIMSNTIGESFLNRYKIKIELNCLIKENIITQLYSSSTMYALTEIYNQNHTCE